MIAGANGRENGTFEKFLRTDLREGTFPVGSVWRPIGKIFRGTWYILRSDVNLIPSSKLPWSFIRKDIVRVPADLPEGDYVLSLRWDVAFGKQVQFLWCKVDFFLSILCWRCGCHVPLSDWSELTKTLKPMRTKVRFTPMRSMRSLELIFRVHLKLLYIHSFLC